MQAAILENDVTDVKKAFDMVNHDILLFTLNTYGISGVEHKYVEIYL